MKLETHKRMIGSSSDILKYLVDLYIQTSDTKNLLKIYKELYLMQRDEQYLQAIIDIYINSYNYILNLPNLKAINVFVISIIFLFIVVFIF